MYIVDCSTLKLVYYDGNDCMVQSFVSPLTGFTSCTPYISGTFMSSVNGYCSVGTKPQILMNSAVATVYEDVNGCGGDPVAFNAYATEMCLNMFGNVTYESAYDYITCDPQGKYCFFEVSSCLQYNVIL